MENDPLAQLRDIHIPDSSGWWPLAWGWWVLIALLLVLGAWALHAGLKRRRRQGYRRDAAAALERAYQRYQRDSDTGAYLQTLSELLRRTSLSALPKESGQAAAALSGPHWLHFLDAGLPEGDDGFSKGPGRALLTGPYQPNPEADVQALQALAHRWIRHHRIRAQWLREPEATDA